VYRHGGFQGSAPGQLAQGRLEVSPQRGHRLTQQGLGIALHHRLRIGAGLEDVELLLFDGKEDAMGLNRPGEMDQFPLTVGQISLTERRVAGH
jgi:hypothetical protein